jgi:hypothetical protein
VEPENGELTARWTALTLWAPEATQARYQEFVQTTPFHVKPIAHDDLLSNAMVTKQGADTGRPNPSKAVQAVLSKEESKRDCRRWLEQAMRQSPNRRPYPKGHWRQEARTRWGISWRVFDEVWDDAIASTRAFAWAAAGAPKKSTR